MQSSIPVSLHFDYVLIIEFLADDDYKTGSILASSFCANAAKIHFKLETCSTSEQVLNAISRAITNIPSLGIPILHLEAHGDKRTGISNVGGIGYNLPDESWIGLSWKTLWNALRKLNIATDFNLLVVAAACFGDDVFYGLSEELQSQNILPAAFMATIGFNSEVNPERLLHAMIVLYVGLQKGLSLSDSIGLAKKKLSGDEVLVERWTISILHSAIKNFLSNLREENADYYWKRYLSEDPDCTIPKEEFLERIMGLEPLGAQTFIASFLSYETHPHNRQRFSVLID